MICYIHSTKFPCIDQTMWNDDRKRPGKRYSYKMRTKWVNIGMICVYAVVQCILKTFTIFIAVQRFVNGSVWHKMQYLRRFEHRTSRSTFIAEKNTRDYKHVWWKKCNKNEFIRCFSLKAISCTFNNFPLLPLNPCIW